MHSTRTLRSCIVYIYERAHASTMTYTIYLPNQIVLIDVSTFLLQVSPSLSSFSGYVSARAHIKCTQKSIRFLVSTRVGFSMFYFIIIYYYYYYYFFFFGGRLWNDVQLQLL